MPPNTTALFPRGRHGELVGPPVIVRADRIFIDSSSLVSARLANPAHPLSDLWVKSLAPAGYPERYMLKLMPALIGHHVAGVINAQVGDEVTGDCAAHPAVFDDVQRLVWQAMAAQAGEYDLALEQQALSTNTPYTGQQGSDQRFITRWVPAGQASSAHNYHVLVVRGSVNQPVNVHLSVDGGQVSVRCLSWDVLLIAAELVADDEAGGQRLLRMTP